MATDFPDSAAMAATNNLFAAVDMGTNSFKLLIVLFDSSTGHFFTLDQRKESVLLGLDTAQVISPSSVDRAVAVLGKFQQVMHFYHISSSHVRVVATSAVREASNQSDFTETLRQTLDLHIDVLSGLDEARLIYQGVLQFCSLVNFTVLTVDIGGGSTEFVIGNNGNVLHAISIKLGHVTLTQTFIETEKMREHIRSALASSGLVDKIKEYKIDKVVGSSGTIKAIEKAVCEYTINSREIEGVVEVNNRDWKFNEKELTELVERLEVEGEEKREAFFKKRAKFIVAGAILLEEIFKGLGIEEMEVSGYALGEGVIKELIWQVPERSHVLNTNERWMSVVRLAMRFNNKKRMQFASTCVWIAKEIFEGIRRWNELNNEIVMYFEEQDFEYLEAACLLHNIGLYAGKKGYHKKSYCMVMDFDLLQGYSSEEVKLIGLLVKHHRKKFPKGDHKSLEGFTEQVKLKFRMLCSILRLSVVTLQYQPENIQNFKFSTSDIDFKLVLDEARNHPQSLGSLQPLVGGHGAELEKELEHFGMVFQKKLSLLVSSSIT